jgi:hypothetical protein
VPLAQLPRSLRRRMCVHCTHCFTIYVHASNPIGRPTELDGMTLSLNPASNLIRRTPSEIREGTAGWDVDPGAGRARRLETHAWHAKRMRMSSSSSSSLRRSSNSSISISGEDGDGASTWGFCLGLSATRKPSKATIRAARSRRRCVLHDASYTRVLELAGPADAIAALLAACLDPSSALAAELLTAPLAWSGARVADAVFHRPGAFPRGALGPVRWLWRPVGPGREWRGTHAALWLWLHPAFADEARACLQAHIAESEAAASSSRVQLRPIPDLVLLEARGPGAHPLLRRVLRPVHPPPLPPSPPPPSPPREQAQREGEVGGNGLWAGLLRHVSSARPETFPAHGTVVALRVADPREARPCRSGRDVFSLGGGDVEEEQEEEEEAPRRQKANKTRRLRLRALLHEGWPAVGEVARSSLWEDGARAAAGLAARSRTDAVVNARRHARRRAATWQGVLRAEGKEAEVEGKEGEGESLAAEAWSVPVLLVARGGRGSKGLFLDGGVSSARVT